MTDVCWYIPVVVICCALTLSAIALQLWFEQMVRVPVIAIGAEKELWV